jgi:hypothetical protein
MCVQPAVLILRLEHAINDVVPQEFHIPLAQPNAPRRDLGVYWGSSCQS